MVDGIQRLRKDLKLFFVGIQEATVSIADHVNSHVKKVKTTMDARDLEKQIKDTQALIGKRVYSHPESSLEDLYKDNNIKDLVINIEQKHKILEGIEGTVSPLDALQDFERLLVRSKFVIQHIIVPETFHGTGKTIRQLAFPPQMLIFFIKKKGETEIAHGETIIDARDEITFLCDKEKVTKYRSFWIDT